MMTEKEAIECFEKAHFMYDQLIVALLVAYISEV